MSVEGGSTSSTGTVAVAGGTASPEGSSVASSISFGHSFGVDTASQLGGLAFNVGLPSGSLRGFSAEAIFNNPLAPATSQVPEFSVLTKTDPPTRPSLSNLGALIAQTEELTLDKFSDPFELNKPETADITEDAPKVSILSSEQVREYLSKDAKPNVINQIDVDLPNQVQVDAEDPSPVKEEISFSKTPVPSELKETAIVQGIAAQNDANEAIEVVIDQTNSLDQAIDKTTDVLSKQDVEQPTVAPLILDPEVGAELEQIDKSIESLRVANFTEEEIEKLIKLSLEHQTLVSQEVKDAVLEQLSRRLFTAKLEVKKIEDPGKLKPALEFIKERDPKASQSRLGQLKEGAQENINPDGTVDAAKAAERVDEHKESNKSEIVRPGGKDHTIPLFKKRVQALGVLENVEDLTYKAQEIDKELMPVRERLAPGTEEKATDKDEKRVKFG